MAKYKRYERYKDSGVEWIGEIPESWTAKKMKHVLQSVRGAIKSGPFGSQLITDDMSGDEQFKVYSQKNVLKKDASLGDDYISPEKFRELKSFSVAAGDLLFTSRGTIGKAFVVPDDAQPGVLHPCLLRARLNKQSIDIGFLLYIVNETDIVIKQVQFSSNATTIEVIYTETLRNITFPVPVLFEQQAIANFLDQKTSEIDDLISDKEQLIKLLQEYRQSVISEAVTKGLNPDVKMKDSGVEWIGEIPEHWQVQRLKRSVEGCIGGVWGDEAQGSEEDIICIRVADFNRQQLSILPENLTIRAVPFSQRQKRELNLGDLLIEKSGGGDLQPVGAVVAYDLEKPAVCSNFITRMPVAKGFCYEFLKYLHNAIYAIRLNCRSIKQTTGIQNLDIESYLNERAAFPPLSEQQAIAGYLNRFTSQVDILVEEIKDSIAKLKEFRQSLISEAVTGKIDVREVI